MQSVFIVGHSRSQSHSVSPFSAAPFCSHIFMFSTPACFHLHSHSAHEIRFAHSHRCTDRYSCVYIHTYVHTCNPPSSLRLTCVPVLRIRRVAHCEPRLGSFTNTHCPPSLPPVHLHYSYGTAVNEIPTNKKRNVEQKEDRKRRSNKKNCTNNLFIYVANQGCTTADDKRTESRTKLGQQSKPLNCITN